MLKEAIPANKKDYTTSEPVREKTNNLGSDQV